MLYVCSWVTIVLFQISRQFYQKNKECMAFRNIRIHRAHQYRNDILTWTGIYVLTHWIYPLMLNLVGQESKISQQTERIMGDLIKKKEKKKRKGNLQRDAYVNDGLYNRTGTIGAVQNGSIDAEHGWQTCPGVGRKTAWFARHWTR